MGLILEFRRESRAQEGHLLKSLQIKRQRWGTSQGKDAIHFLPLLDENHGWERVAGSSPGVEFSSPADTECLSVAHDALGSEAASGSEHKVWTFPPVRGDRRQINK